MVQQQGDRSRAGGYAWILANPTDLEEMIAVSDTPRASTPEWEIEDSGFPSRPCRHGFQLWRGRRRILGGSRQEWVRSGVMRPKRLSEEVLGGKRIEERRASNEGGAGVLINV